MGRVVKAGGICRPCGWLEVSYSNGVGWLQAPTLSSGECSPAVALVPAAVEESAEQSRSLWSKLDGESCSLRDQVTSVEKAGF
jgi:hypothetical protein